MVSPDYEIEVFLGFLWGYTMPDLHIIAGLITAGFVRTDSNVPSLPVMSLKMKK